MAPPRKFMSIPPMAGRNSLSVLVQRDLKQYHGSSLGKRLSFIYTLEPNTPRCWPRLRSRVKNEGFSGSRGRLPCQIAFAVPTSNGRNRIEPE